MPRTDSPLMCSEQPALKQRSDPVDTGQECGSWLTGSIEHRDLVLIPSVLKTSVSAPSVCVHRRPRFNRSFDEIAQDRPGRVRDVSHPDASDSAAAFLGGNHNQHFPVRTAPSRTGLFSADVGLIDLDAARQTIPAWTDHRASKFMEPGPGCRVAPESKHTLKPQGTSP